MPLKREFIILDGYAIDDKGMIYKVINNRVPVGGLFYITEDKTFHCTASKHKHNLLKEDRLEPLFAEAMSTYEKKGGKVIYAIELGPNIVAFRIGVYGTSTYRYALNSAL